MNPDSEPQRLSQGYKKLLSSVQQTGAAEDSNNTPLRIDQSQLDELHGLWHAGQLGNTFNSPNQGIIQIRDFGDWNRNAGADFLRVDIEIDNKWLCGNAVFTVNAEDWYTNNYHQSSLHRETVLHICLQKNSAGHRSLNCNQRESVLICLPTADWQDALRLSPKLDADSLNICRNPLEETSKEQALNILKAAAAYRIACKRKQFLNRVARLGKSQAWYEAWAESLGYYSNRHQMKLLARRAPISELNEENAESILLGTAGFLVPVLPDKSETEDRHYHRITWDIWWPQRDQYGLSEERRPQWNYAGQRPMNHPHRRVAALAETVKRWEEFEPLLKAERLAELDSFRKSLDHHYWTYHSALPSKHSWRPVALVGEERMRAFLINHLLVNDDGLLAWQIYLKQKERSIGSSIKRSFESLFGYRQDMSELLPYCYVQQGVIQLQQDYALKRGAKRSIVIGYPQELSEWQQ